MTILLIELQEDIRLAVHDGDIGGSVVTSAGKTFHELSLGRDGFLGFYDWLRTPTGEVVGVRLSIDEAAAALSSLLPDRRYVVQEAPGIVCIMFRATEEEIDWEASIGQDFGTTRAFRAQDNAVLLTFDAHDLSTADLRRLTVAT